jgi:hyperosmotically inducible periplasmic protein
MLKSFFRFVIICASIVFVAMSLPSCKGSVKDADIEKSVSEKIAASANASGVTSAVKDGVVTLYGMFKDDASRTAFESEVKAIPGVKSVTDNTTVTPPPSAPAPVVITADDTLMKGVTDAIKDFPGVKAEVKDGVITLTGEIKRTSLQTLIMVLNTLKPQKIENKLTIK